MGKCLSRNQGQGQNPGQAPDPGYTKPEDTPVQKIAQFRWVIMNADGKEEYVSHNWEHWATTAMLNGREFLFRLDDKEGLTVKIETRTFELK